MLCATAPFCGCCFSPRQTEVLQCGALWRRAGKIRRVVDAAGALVLRHLGIRAQWTRAIHLMFPIEMRCDDPVGRLPGFDPADKGSYLVEVERPLATRTMAHARDHEQADKVAGSAPAAV